MCKKEHAQIIDKHIFPGIQGGPLMHVVAAKAVALGEALSPEFKKYQQQIVLNAKALAEGLKENGLTLVSGGTDNHLMLLDFSNEKFTGKEAEESLDKAGITVNKNAIPFDKRPPMITSGVRIGTPAVTTRGMKEPEMKEISALIREALRYTGDAAKLVEMKHQVKRLTAKFPLYKELLKEVK